MWKTLAGLAVLLGSCFRRNDDIGFLAQSQVMERKSKVAFGMSISYIVAQGLAQQAPKGTLIEASIGLFH